MSRFIWHPLSNNYLEANGCFTTGSAKGSYGKKKKNIID